MVDLTIDVPVSFQGVSRQKTQRKLGVHIRANDLDDETAIAVLLCARLDCTLTTDPNGQDDADGQQTFGDDSITLPITADTKKLSLNDGEIRYGFALSVPDDLVSADELDPFAFTSGQLKCTRVGKASQDVEDIPIDDEDED